ncbi:MAG: hypothetical protein IJ043_07395 [Clostridia bacterium]|nr:hypothetical protein [Clostridia bacterium]
MAELNNNGNFFRPSENNDSDFNQSPAYPGSWQQVLRNNEGQYCIIDFLIGTENIVQKEGILYDVGVSFVVLFEPRSGNYIVCDLYSIKFVTFAGSGVLPAGKVPKRRV